MIVKSITIACMTLAFSLACLTPVAAKMKEAEAAFHARDFETTIKELKPYFKKKRRPVRASLIMARLYLDGLGVPANYSRAYEYLLPPASKGNAWAATEMGRLYLDGSGVLQSYRDARVWFEKAAKVGYAPAQVELGHIHARGLSVSKNLTLAYAWYNLAAAGLEGDDRFRIIEARDHLTEDMSGFEIDAAQDLSLRWSEGIEVVKPEVFSLLDQATILAEEKFEEAQEELSKLRAVIKKHLQDLDDTKASAAKQAAGKAAKE